ncbi:MAG: hypothetical protein QXY15_09290 [Candidatus Nitrosotenuis sp.]
MSTKVALTLILVSLLASAIYIVDKINEIKLGDAARLIIGLSSLDSSGCKACFKDGIFYYNGCKHCFQDSMSLHTHSSDKQPYEISWSKNQGLYQGDNICSGNKFFPNARAKSGDTYWVEMIRNDLNFTITLYQDSNYFDIFDQVSIKMCSNPTNLHYIRISTEDGKPAANGGRFVGYIDDLVVWNETTSDTDQILTDEKMERLTMVYSQNFDACKTKTCDGWVLQDPNLLYIDTENGNFHFDSQVTATNDNAHYDIGAPLSDSKWLMRFKLHLDLVEKYPEGSGFLPFNRIIRGLVLGVPAIFLPIISYVLTKNKPSTLLGILMVVSGSMIIATMIYSITPQELEQAFNIDVNSAKLRVAYSLFGIFIITSGILKIKRAITKSR